MPRLWMCILSLVVGIYAAPSQARNFQDEQARMELQQSETNNYEAPKEKNSVHTPCRDEVKSGFPTSIGGGGQSGRAMNRSTVECDKEADAEEEEDKSKIDVKVKLSDEEDPEH